MLTSCEMTDGDLFTITQPQGVHTTEYIFLLEMKQVSVSAHSAGAYTATLLVMVNVVKVDGRSPPPTPAWANFTLMIECTPESDCCYSVYSVVHTTPQQNH